MANKKEEVTTPEIDVNKIKADLIDYVKSQVDVEVDNKIKEKEKKYIKSRNRKIVFLEILIFLLVAIIIGSLIFLYNDHYFDKYRKNYTPEECQKEIAKNCNNQKDNNENIKDEDSKEEIEKPTLEELIAKYEGILDNIKITNKSNYLEDFYKERYTDELKLSMVTDLIDLKEVIDDESIIIESEMISELSKTLFAKELNLVTYKYNNVELHYYKKLEKFVAADIAEEGATIKRNIIEIEEKDNKVLITTEEYYEENGKEMNPLTNIEGKEKKTYEFILKDEKYILNV